MTSGLTLVLALFAAGIKTQVIVGNVSLIEAYKADCPNIGQVPWSGSCIADYATVTASLIEDLICIRQKTAGRAAEVKAALNGIKISYADIICNCDKPNCRNNQADGCQGGRADIALKWIQETGVVGGSAHGFQGPDIPWNAGYKNLTIRNCLNFYTPPCTFKSTGGKYNNKCTLAQPVDFDPMTNCPANCDYKTTQGKPVKDYRDKAILKGSPVTSSNLGTSQVNTIPVIGYMDVYEDLFLNNGVDIYVNMGGRTLGTFAVKIVGHGEDLGVKYWLVVLPFGKDVGNNGVVRVLRGVNHCSIEDSYTMLTASQVVDDLAKIPTPAPAPGP